MASSVNFSSAIKGLDRLNTVIQSKLAHSMAVAGAAVIRDEARMRTPVGPTGNLARSMYEAKNHTATTNQKVVYSVSWNTRIAPHGHLVEFGHYQSYVTIRLDHALYGADYSEYVTLPYLREDGPKWIPGTPFLRPAYEAKKGAAAEAMKKRAKVVFPQLMKETT